MKVSKILNTNERLLITGTWYDYVLYRSSGLYILTQLVIVASSKMNCPKAMNMFFFLPQIIAQFPYVSWTKMVPNPKKLKNIYIEMLVNVINNLQTESLF